MFTLDNTHGFSTQDLELINKALAQLMKDVDPDDPLYTDKEKYASEKVSDNWNTTNPNTLESLTR